MLVVLCVLVLGLVLALIPFAYPDTIMNTPGAWLNHLLGTMLGAAGIEYGLVAGTAGVYALSMRGVLVLFGIPIAVLLYLMRTR
jgi:hypothetical protein